MLNQIFRIRGWANLAVLVLTFSLFAAPARVTATHASSGEVNFDALDGYIEGQMEKHGIRGISPAVTSGTEIIYLQGYGTAGVDRPMTPQTPMYISSQSKSFTNG